MRTGSNLPAVGEYNQTLVLDLIRRSPEGLSRVELTARTGLSAQTLSNVTRRLADEGLIAEAGKVISGPGKPRTLLKLEPSSRFAVGVHLDPVVDTAVVVDMAGEVVAHDEIDRVQGASAAQLVAGVGEAVDAIVKRAGIPRARVLGVGVAAPGPFDARGGRLLNPPLLPQWHHVNVREDLGAVTGLPVIVEKDVTAAMVGEMWFDRSDVLADAMFLYYGAGVGLGVAISGSPVRGRTGNAGGIAHIVVDARGPRCECGSRGCLGVSIEPRALLAEAGYDAVSGSDSRPDLDRLVADAHAGREPAGTVLRRAGERIARALVVANNLLDVDEVVLGGPVWERLAGVLSETVARRVSTDPASTSTRAIVVRHSRVGPDVAAVGAACLMLDGAFAARPARMMIAI
ncbi:MULTISPECIES: ROK family transcriptional regulator [Microbacterium]|uniref:ROK family transcriptional regulator n=1 Tax=Microbacterium TaxID=33882 RepID=UPI00278416D9|nr:MULTISPECIES: ROK family transcriptional regulator [Microbacterium]MDQ1084783.1 putative NBD/HSP70 family sugar kinase [Microbacterium sp. SORGH_AS_0344]MDQ1169938.1 putative NBD/HSP70 family sugar kinase [Microbacterium proteolyticum]